MPMPQFSGFTLIVHGAIIVLAFLLQKFHLREGHSQFQTYGKKGGVVASPTFNSIIAYGLIIGINGAIIFLASRFLYLAYLTGYDEPQRVFLRDFFSAISIDAIPEVGLVLSTLLLGGLFITYPHRTYAVLDSICSWMVYRTNNVFTRMFRRDTNVARNAHKGSKSADAL